MNPVLSRILETQQVELADGSSLPLHSHISEEEGNYLQRIISQIRPTQTLEVGFAYGISTLFICEALSNVGGSLHIAIDPYQEGPWQSVGLCNAERAGYLPLIEFHREPSHLALSALEVEGRRFGFAFIDGSHTFDNTLVDFFHIDKILNVGGVIVFDDTHLGGVRKVVRYVLTNRAYSVYEREDASVPLSAIFRYTPLRRIAKPEIKEPDTLLGIPSGRFIALRKDSEDVFGNGENGTRHWAAYKEF